MQTKRDHKFSHLTEEKELPAVKLIVPAKNIDCRNTQRQRMIGEVNTCLPIEKSFETKYHKTLE